ncbi:MAG: YncE family protein [Cytophagaceae bacterium]|nr:YncE family protein [Gemmatimonadaceae bacterium]
MLVPERDYLVYVGSESADMVALVRFGPAGIKVERQRYVGASRAEIAGPHGVALSPDGRHYYVSIAHGVPNGYLQKYSTATDSAEGNVMLGSFPASLQVSPDGYLAYVVNFNLHGDMVPSSVSVVATAEMAEVARIETCTMPHGSRLTRDGSRHYSACMMDELLVEIDTRTLQVSRHFRLTKGREGGMSGPPVRATGATAHDMGGHGMDAPRPGDTSCQPTWALPAADGSRIWVACNKSSEVVEVDGRTWTLRRRIAAGPGVYNLGVTHDGTRLIATNKRGQSVSIFEVATGRELARIPTTRAVVHGVAISDDDRYAFISMEGRGAEPGGMDVIDLTTRTRVATVDLGQQAGGIDFWKSEPASR